MTNINNTINSTSKQDFLVTTATAGVDRKLSITNTDNTNAASHSHLQLTTGGGAGGDPYTNYSITGGGTFSAGIDNSASDQYIISDGATPSAGNQLFVLNSNGAALQTQYFYQIYNKNNDNVFIQTSNTNTANASGAYNAVVCSHTSTSDAWINFNIYDFGTPASVTQYALGPDNSDSDTFKLTYANASGAALSPSGGTTLLTVTTTGVLSLYGQTIAMGGSYAGVPVGLQAGNLDATNAASNCICELYTQPAGGDPFVYLLVQSGGGGYSFGVDNSDSDKLKITTGTSPSAGTELLTITTAGAATIPATLKVGSGTIGTTLDLNIAHNLSGGYVGQEIINNSNTAGSYAMIGLITGPAAADPLITYNISSTQSWTHGIDNSDSDKFKLSASNALGTTDVMVSTTAGETTWPLQPAFLATQTAAQGPLAVNAATTFTVNNEIFDQNSDYNSGTYTFTAPITGRYMLSAQVRLVGADTASTYYNIYIATSNRNYYYTFMLGSLTADPSYLSWPLSVLADMDAGDTAYFAIAIPNAGASQAVVDTSQVVTWFSGYLSC